MNKKASRVLSVSLATALTATLVIPAAADLIKKDLSVDAGLSVYVDGKKQELRDAGGAAVDVFAADGTTYLPVRAMSNALGAQVSYDAENYRVYVDTAPVDEKAADYLKAYFGVEPMTGTVSADVFNAALVKIFGEDAKTAVGAGLTVAQAVKAAVESCGLRELALTYSAEKSAASTAGAAKIEAGCLPYVAAALDTSLASGTWSFDSGLTGEVAAQLLMNAVNIAGKGRNYLGNVSDPDIYQKLQSAYSSFTLFDDGTLKDLGDTLLFDGAITGYNLKYDGYDAKFLPEYTMTYVNSDILHGIQLIALLNAAGLDAKVQLEPKSSMWLNTDYEDKTDPEAQDGGVAVVGSANDKKDFYGLVVSALEYDMQLEFDTIADKEAFDAIVEQYAKKYKVNQNEDGTFTPSLIRNSEWHPVYTSDVPVSTGDFQHIRDNVIHSGSYTLHSNSLADQTASITAAVKKAAPELETQVNDLYCCAAFYRYLTASRED